MPFIIAPPGGNGSSGGQSPVPDAQLTARVTATENVNTQQSSDIESLKSGLISTDSSRVALGERVNTLEGNYVDYSPTIQTIQEKDGEQDTLISLATSKNDEQDLKITSIESDISSHTSRISTAESSLLNKADLVSGKIPLTQLPDLPVGRKVSVPDLAARLALSVHPDLTIAYESDTADAWALDAGEDPSDPDNWDKLGNAQATGVQSFNGRTANVSPQSGDYDSSMITTSSTRSFVSDVDKARWDDKATTAQVAASTETLRSEVNAGYVKTNTRSVANGIATLGSDGKVPASQLPALGLTSSQLQRIDTIESNTSLANAKGDSAAENILFIDGKLETYRASSQTRIDTLETNRTADKALIDASTTKNTQQDNRLTAIESGYVASSQKGVANGVAALDANSKISSSNVISNVAGGFPLLDSNNRIQSNYLYRDGANGIAPIDADRRVPIRNLPEFMPSRPRVWRNVKGSRVVGTYYTNNSGNDMTIHVRGAASTDVQRYIQILVRETSTSTAIDLRCDVTGAAGNRWVQLTAIVPAGWQYSLTTTGGSTTANTEYWYEFS